MTYFTSDNITSGLSVYNNAFCVLVAFSYLFLSLFFNGNTKNVYNIQNIPLCFYNMKKSDTQTWLNRCKGLVLADSLFMHI